MENESKDSPNPDLEGFRQHYPRRRSVEDQTDRRRHGMDEFEVPHYVGEPMHVGPFKGKGPKNYVRADASIFEEACEALTDHPDIDATHLEVTVQEGKVRLSGSVPATEMKRLAEEEVQFLKGVRQVSNELQISGEVA